MAEAVLKKAVFKGAFRDKGKDGWKHTDLLYEYRGFEYFVTKHNNGCMDKSLRQQHLEAQQKIDEKISHLNDPIPEYRYEGSEQEGFDQFWDAIEEM